MEKQEEFVPACLGRDVEIDTMFGKRTGKVIESGVDKEGIRYRLVDAGATVWRQEYAGPWKWETKGGQPKAPEAE